MILLKNTQIILTMSVFVYSHNFIFFKPTYDWCQLRSVRIILTHQQIITLRIIII